MIFFNNQLMKTDNQCRLYMVSNPLPFERYDDHEAGLYIQLHEMVELATEQKESPIALIEEYLGISYTGGETTDEIVAFLFQTSHVTHALYNLRDNWKEMNQSFPEDSLMFGGVSKEQAIQIYYETSFRSYLETLSQLFND